MNIQYVLRRHKQQLGAFICLVVIFVGLSFYNPVIHDINNILNIGKQASINLVLALGMTVVIISGGIDLSVGSILALLVVVTAWLFNVLGLNIWLSLVCGFVAATACGLLNGLIIQYGKVPPFVATLGAMGIIRGIVLNLAQGNPGMSFPAEFLEIADGTFMGIPYPICIALAVTLLAWGLLRYTMAGRSFFALGGNEEASRLSGINIASSRIYPYVFSAITCAIAGVIFAARVGAAPPGAGQGYELSAIAAAVIGGTPLSGGRGNIVGTAIGALLIAVIQNGLTILNIDPYWQGIIVGAIIIAAVVIANFRSNERRA